MSKLIIHRYIESILAPTKVEQNIHYACVWELSDPTATVRPSEARESSFYTKMPWTCIQTCNMCLLKNIHFTFIIRIFVAYSWSVELLETLNNDDVKNRCLWSSCHCGGDNYLIVVCLKKTKIN